MRTMITVRMIRDNGITRGELEKLGQIETWYEVPIGGIKSPLGPQKTAGFVKMQIDDDRMDDFNQFMKNRAAEIAERKKKENDGEGHHIQQAHVSSQAKHTGTASLRAG